MKGLETGKDKIQKICDTLRKETLDPAKQEAREIVENAHLQAAEIVAEAKKVAQQMVQTQEREGEERRRVFDASLQLAAKQGIEELKQKIEEELFNKELQVLTGKEMAQPEVIAQILNSFLQTMEAKGIEDDLVATIPKAISPRAINSLLAERVLARLKNQIVSLGDFSGGVQIALKGRKITIDISDTVIREILEKYIRRDFRDLIFTRS